jgi:hypothetical protein
MSGFTPILAEIADKEPAITVIWSIAAFFCFIGFLLCRWRRVATLLAFPLAAFWAWAMFAELHDPYVGAAIMSELGRGYVLQAYVAALIPFVAMAIGYWRRRHDVVYPHASANRRRAMPSGGSEEFARDCCSRPGVSGGGR